MSTHCNIHFNHGQKTYANIYLRTDGYPDAVLPNFQIFFREVATQCDKTLYPSFFDDAPYLAAKFVIWQSDYNVKVISKFQAIGKLAIYGIAVVNEDSPMSEYIYTVDCMTQDVNGFPIVNCVPEPEIDEDDK
jgi:hypothetical protein